MSKAEVIQGRAILDEYQQGHQALHSKPWTPDVPAQHTPLMDKMKSQLQQLGFETLDDFYRADGELQGVEYSEYLLGLELTPSSPLRLIDVSDLSLYAFCALNEVVSKLRAEDKIADTILYQYFEGGHTVAQLGGDTTEAKAFRERCEQYGIEYCRSIFATRGTLCHDEVTARLVTRNRFTNLFDAWEAMLSVVVKTLWSLGVEVSIRPDSNNIMVSGKKVAQGVKRVYGDVYFIKTAIFRDFDYNLGANVFDEPDIQNKVTTLKEVLRREVPVSEFKAKYIQSCLQTFSSQINEEMLDTKEQSLLSYLQPKYESRAWNERGETDSVLIEIIRDRE